jgi:hypothetical protein
VIGVGVGVLVLVGLCGAWRVAEGGRCQSTLCWAWLCLPSLFAHHLNTHTLSLSLSLLHAHPPSYQPPPPLLHRCCTVCVCVHDTHPTGITVLSRDKSSGELSVAQQFRIDQVRHAIFKEGKRGGGSICVYAFLCGVMHPRRRAGGAWHGVESTDHGPNRPCVERVLFRDGRDESPAPHNHNPQRPTPLSPTQNQTHTHTPTIPPKTTSRTTTTNRTERGHRRH